MPKGKFLEKQPSDSRGFVNGFLKIAWLKKKKLLFLVPFLVLGVLIIVIIHQNVDISDGWRIGSKYVVDWRGEKGG